MNLPRFKVKHHLLTVKLKLLFGSQPFYYDEYHCYGYPGDVSLRCVFCPHLRWSSRMHNAAQLSGQQKITHAWLFSPAICLIEILGTLKNCLPGWRRENWNSCLVSSGFTTTFCPAFLKLRSHIPKDAKKISNKMYVYIFELNTYITYNSLRVYAGIDTHSKDNILEVLLCGAQLGYWIMISTTNSPSFSLAPVVAHARGTTWKMAPWACPSLASRTLALCKVESLGEVTPSCRPEYRPRLREINHFGDD